MAPNAAPAAPRRRRSVTVSSGCMELLPRRELGVLLTASTPTTDGNPTGLTVELARVSGATGAVPLRRYCEVFGRGATWCEQIQLSPRFSSLHEVAGVERPKFSRLHEVAGVERGELLGFGFVEAQLA